jgi:hypothetical protein
MWKVLAYTRMWGKEEYEVETEQQAVEYAWRIMHDGLEVKEGYGEIVRRVFYPPTAIVKVKVWEDV